MNEDPRKCGLKNGIRQLSTAGIVRTLDNVEMAMDDGNYVDGKFCPLARGAGLDRLEWKIEPSDAAVAAILHLLGFKVNNTRGLKGKFFRKSRARDYRIAAGEVLDERRKERNLRFASRGLIP